MRTKFMHAAGFIDRTLRQWAIIVLFLIFSLGASMTWIARAAANNVEQGLEPTRSELRREMVHEERAQVAELADHDRRLAVIETEQRNQGKQLDEVLSYIKSLVFGVFGMLALQASSVLWGKRQKKADAD